MTDTSAALAPVEERTTAMLCWVLSLVAGFIPALIFFLTAKDKPFVYRNAAMVLTMTIAMIPIYIIAIILAIVTMGLGAILMPIIGLLALILIIMGAIAANKGERFNPPVIGDLTQKIFKV